MVRFPSIEPRAPLVAVLLVLLVGGTVHADTTQERARQEYRAGERLHRAGRYDEAIEAYQRAYDLDPVPALLFNLGQVYRLNGDEQRALDSYRRYLSEEPDGRGAPEARRHVRELEAAIAARTDTRPAEPEPEPSREPEPAPAPPGPSTQPPAVAAPAPAPPRLGPPEETGERARRRNPALIIAGVSSGVVGLAAVAAGVAFGLRARELEREQEMTYDPDGFRRGEAAERNMVIAYSVGGAALIASGILFYYGALRPAPGYAIGPLLTPDGAGLTACARF